MTSENAAPAAASLARLPLVELVETPWRTCVTRPARWDLDRLDQRVRRAHPAGISTGSISVRVAPITLVELVETR